MSFTPIGIYQIGNLLEGKKRNSERKEYLAKMKGFTCQNIDVCYKKIWIFMSLDTLRVACYGISTN